MEKSYVEFSPYSFALNSPDFHIDLHGAVVRDANGNIVLTATSGTRPTLHLNQLFFDASRNVFYGYEYEFITGYILDNAGLRIQVQLPTSNEVSQVIYDQSQMKSIGYDASGVPQVGIPRVGETPIHSRVDPGLDGSAHCTGVSCLDGKFVPNSGIAKEQLAATEEDQWVNSLAETKKGDVGAYVQGGVVQHFELFTDKGVVTSKGGVAPFETGVTPGKNWDPKGFDQYVVARKALPYQIAKDPHHPDRNLNSLGYPSPIEHGVHVVSGTDFNKIQSDIQSRKKA